MKEISDYSDRYAHLDGSPYTTKGIRRLLSTPPIQASAITIIMTAASQEILNRSPDASNNFLLNIMANIGGSTLTMIYGLWLLNNPRFSLSKQAVIDKSGRSLSDLKENTKGKNHYALSSAVYITVATITYATTVSLKVHSHIPECIQLTYGACALRNWLNLATGKWNINSSPPRPKPNLASLSAKSLSKQEIR